MKKCRCCGGELPPSMFSRDAKNADGLNTRCRTCRAAMYKAWDSRRTGDSVWPRYEDERVLDRLSVGWRYPVITGHVMARIAA